VLTEAWSILNRNGPRGQGDFLGPLREALVSKYQVPHFGHLGVRLPQGPGFLIVNLGGSISKWQHKVRACNRACAMHTHWWTVAAPACCTMGLHAEHQSATGVSVQSGSDEPAQSSMLPQVQSSPRGSWMLVPAAFSDHLAQPLLLTCNLCC
jgi:hypothetical protein